jgi:hypothetical protein
MTTTHNWQTLDTAPRDGTHFLLFYGLRGCVCTAYYERKYGYKYEGIIDGVPQEVVVYQCWHLLAADFNDYHICCDEQDLTDCYWQPLMELPI